MNAWLKTIIRKRMSTGLFEALQSLRSEFEIQKRHRAGVRQARRFLGLRSLQLNFGCGPNYKPGWVNIDLFASCADLLLDLREPLPLANAVATHIYSEHVFEHLSYPDEANRLLAECLRVLVPGGVLDVGVPDTEQAIYGYYVHRDPEKLARARELWHREPWCDLPLHQLNYHFRQGKEHKYAWDYETLASALTKAGFVAISRRAFDEGLDDTKRRGSLYVRAHKAT